MHRSPRTSGFTLVELSIVLVIIGVIVSGVLVGQDLIYSGQMRKVISQSQECTAFYAFKNKYNALPGDLKNASTYWAGVGNGNGDTLVRYYVYTNAGYSAADVSWTPG